MVAWGTPGFDQDGFPAEFEAPHMAPVIEFMANARETLQQYIPCKVYAHCATQSSCPCMMPQPMSTTQTQQPQLPLQQQ